MAVVYQTAALHSFDPRSFHALRCTGEKARRKSNMADTTHDEKGNADGVRASIDLVETGDRELKDAGLDEANVPSGDGHTWDLTCTADIGHSSHDTTTKKPNAFYAKSIFASFPC